MIQDLILGDCLEKMNDIKDKSIDLILCDLPYQITSCKWDIIIPFNKLWEHYERIIKENAVIALNASQPFTSALIMSNPNLYRHEWIWIKNRGSNFANTVREPMKEHESVVIFSRGKWTYNKQMQERTGGGKNLIGAIQKNKGGKSNNYRHFEGRDITLAELRVPSSWQKFNTEVGYHPTQKPVALCEYIIKTYSNENDLVLDNCCGSGTTLVAAKKLKRQFIGIEKEEEYYKITVDRLSKC